MNRIITGCPRSATKYTVMVLRKLGYDVGHEEWGMDGMVNWRFDACRDPFHGVLLHQVREPLATIGSLATIRDHSWRYICEQTPVKMDWDIARRCAETWLYWNQMAEAKASWTYRIEDLPKVWPEWCERLGIEGEYEQVAGIPKHTHHRKHKCVTWAWLEEATPLAGEIREMARRYGYDTRN